MVFDAQLMSVKEYKVVGGQPPRAELLPLTQRYAALTTSLLLLNADYEVRLSLHLPPLPHVSIH